MQLNLRKTIIARLVKRIDVGADYTVKKWLRIVRYFMGDPDEVFAYGNRFCRTDWVVEDCSETLMHLADGRIAKVLTTLGCVAEYSMRTVIHGTEGTIMR